MGEIGRKKLNIKKKEGFKLIWFIALLGTLGPPALVTFN